MPTNTGETPVPLMNAEFDIAVVGSGFGGSLLAMIARRLGRSVILLERGRHPRFAIGESSTPLASLLLEELARRYGLPRLLPLTKWGAWQKTHPRIGCGLKRGFTFYHHRFGQPFAHDSERRDQLLVAASPRDEIGDTHWYRADFDHFLVQEAQGLGAEYVDLADLHRVTIDDEWVKIDGRRNNAELTVRARILIDASGPRGFLHRAIGLPEVSRSTPTQALYTHFTGVKRWEDLDGPSPARAAADEPPYPVDDAAMHHIFDGGWIWVLRFNNGIVSAGVAATGQLAGELRFADGAPAWQRLLRRLPTVREQFAGASVEFPFVHVPRLSFRSGVAAGSRWALLPSAAGFVDPLLSTGFPLTLLGVSRLAGILAADWDGPIREKRLEQYAHSTLKEVDAAILLVDALYSTMNDFPLFAALSLLYFAAVSYSEMARRLNRPELAGGFLMHDHPAFGPQLRSCCRRALDARNKSGLTAAAREQLLDDIYRAIGPIDVAGLSDRTRRSWYPADARASIIAAGKLKAGENEIRQALVGCGFLRRSDGCDSLWT
jgi:tetracycline 7-halogenase / FADH2 O2-dependent halogenase